MRLLIADGEGQQARHLAHFFKQNGFDVRVAANTSEAKQYILDWHPRVVLVDLLIPPEKAYGLLDFVREEPRLRKDFVNVMVISSHNSEFNVRQAYTKGASDYLVRPLSKEALLNRVAIQCRSHRPVPDLNKKDLDPDDQESLMLHLTDLVLRQAIMGTNISETLRNLTKMAALKMSGVRCSIVHCLNYKRGIVIVSNDSRAATGLELDLSKYPEILNVMATGQVIAIENLKEDPILQHVLSQIKSIQFNSLIVCPVVRDRNFFGVLSLRMPASKGRLSDNEIRFVEIVSHVTSLILKSENFSNISDLVSKTA